MEIKDWLKSSQYLPGFMRDFHDQKDLFKRINEFVENRKKKNIEENQEYWNRNYPDWVTAHVFTVDFFLWYMAICGYTLQKSRHKFEFEDVQEDVQKFMKQYRHEAMLAMGLHPIDDSPPEEEITQ